MPTIAKGKGARYMKVIKQTSTEFVLRGFSPLVNPFITLVFALMFIGPLFFVIGIGLREDGEVKIMCERVEPKLINCQYLKRSLIDKESATINFVQDVQYRADERSGDEDGNDLVDYYVVLITKNREVPILKSSHSINGESGNYEIAQRFAKDLKQFLQSEQKSVVLTGWSWRFFTLSLYCSILCIPLTFIVILFLQFITITFDKHQNKISFSNLSILGLKKKTFNLQEVKRIEVKETTNVHEGLCFIARIVMCSGQEHVIFGGGNQKEVHEVISQIKEFLADVITV